MDAPTRELEAYFAGHATADQLQAIEAWLHADPANAKAFMAQLHFRELVGETLREQANADAPIGSVLAELAKIEAAAEPITLAPEPVQQAVEDDGALSAHELASVGGYLLGKALTSKPAILCYAAAIAIAAIVLINPWGGGEEPDLSASNTQDMPAASAEQTPRGSDVVATLTATHNATWAPHPGGDHRPGALRQGTQLSAGQRLVLTQGFAEITTNDGAIAIIEAPATIQLIDDNALRLHAGKLVGICETESSRGFTVRTPHMDITDLGTRFGVATTRQATEVHVIEGEVQASRANAAPDTKPTTLIANMSARTSADTDAITRIAHDTERFAAINPGGSLNRSVLAAGAAFSLDLTDIVAGGDGAGEQSGVGIDLADGRFVQDDEMSRRNWYRHNGGSNSPVSGSAFIDSVFVIDRLSGRAVLWSGADVFDGFPKGNAELPTHDGYGFIQSVSDGSIVVPREHSPLFSTFSGEETDVGQNERCLVMSSGAGVTLDLDTLSRTHEATPRRFTARVFSAEAQSRRVREDSGVSYADIWVFIDGQARYARRSVTSQDGVLEIDIELNAEDRYLTLAVSQGGDGGDHDWLVFSRPLIEMRPGDR